MPFESRILNFIYISLLLISQFSFNDFRSSERSQIKFYFLSNIRSCFTRISTHFVCREYKLFKMKKRRNRLFVFNMKNQWFFFPFFNILSYCTFNITTSYTLSSSIILNHSREKVKLREKFTPIWKSQKSSFGVFKV